MKGREEADQKIETYIDNKLKTAPDIVKKYSYSFYNKTLLTKKMYISYVMDFIDYYSDRDICTLKASDINIYMNSIRYKDPENKIENGTDIRSVRLAAIRNYYDFLINDGYLDINPCAKINPPKSLDEKEITIMTPGEVKQLISNIENGLVKKKYSINEDKWKLRDIAIVTLGCRTGLRVSAIVEIDLDDIDFNDNIIYVIEKGNKKRKIIFGEDTKIVLQKWIDARNYLLGNIECNALFISRKKQRLSVRSVEEMIQKYSYNINKHITPHKMRSTCATNLYDATGDIYLVQDILGHKNISSTRRYAKVSDNRRKNAIDILETIY